MPEKKPVRLRREAACGGGSFHPFRKPERARVSLDSPVRQGREGRRSRSASAPGEFSDSGLFLPMSREDMERRGWEELDVLLVSGDAYVDHPSFANALIGRYLEALARTEILVFDKTGTLTKGTFQVTAVHPEEISEERLLELAALAESYSDHPISLSLKAAYQKEIDAGRVKNAEELAGRGVRATVDGLTVCAGNSRLMKEAGADWYDCHLTGTVVHVAVEGRYAGHIVISDVVKPDAAEAVADLKRQGIRRTVMLTGDTPAVGEQVGRELGLDEVHAGLLPADKVEEAAVLIRSCMEAQPFPEFDVPIVAEAAFGPSFGELAEMEVVR